jgi:hypothetical protein
MSAKSIVTGGARFRAEREGKLLNPLDLIWFVPAWGSRGIVFVIVLLGNNMFLSDCNRVHLYESGFLCWLWA